MVVTVLAMTSLKAGGEEALEQYLSVVTPLVDSAGATLVSSYEVSETLSGSELPQNVSVVEYPSHDALQMAFDHPDYLSLKQIKDMAFSRYDLCALV